MAHFVSRSAALLFAFMTASLYIGGDQDPRVALFDDYNRAATYQDARPLVSGVLARVIEAVESQDPQQLQLILARQRLASYHPRIVEIDEATSFLVLENITSSGSRDPDSQAYLLSKAGNAHWTLANRLLPDSVIKTLWTTHFTPSQFVQPSSCTIDGKGMPTQSALAVRQRDSIEITLYPFTFSDADLDYWREVSGMNVKDDAAATSHFTDAKLTVCRVIVKIDGTNQPSLLNVGFNDPASGRSALWQPSKANVAALILDHDVVTLVTAGAVGSSGQDFRWNVKIKVPVWTRGL
jgi:hypothetical protein